MTEYRSYHAVASIPGRHRAYQSRGRRIAQFLRRIVFVGMGGVDE